jgi:hypothetical protein
MAGRGRRGARRRRSIAKKRLASTVEDQGFLKTLPAGDDQLQYNNNGNLDSISQFTWDETDLKINDDTKLKFGTNNDAYINYNESNDDFLTISGSANGIALSGSTVYIDNKMGVGVQAASVTHAITLPDNADETGRVKANAYMTYSSERFKESIENISDPMSIVSNLRGVSFTWKKNKEKDYGFIAEEVGKELPNLVEWDTPIVENSPRALSMDYTRIVPILLEAIKAQQDQIDSLESEIKLLKSID